MNTRVLHVDPDQPDPAAIEEAAAALREGRLVAFPTETVYGLGANALDEHAVRRLFEAKGRPANDPLIVHIAHIGQLGRVAADVPRAARALGLAFWAGPLTVILRKQAVVPDIVTAGLPTVAVRVPAHRVARALMEMAGVPVAAPSANLFSRPSPTSAGHVLEDLGGRIDLVVDGGRTPIGVESSIVDCSVEPPVLRRPGGVTVERLREIVPELRIEDRFATGQAPQVAPGQLLRHYAPRSPITLYEGDRQAVLTRVASDVRARTGAGARVGLLAPEDDVMALAPELAAPASAGRVATAACGRARAVWSTPHTGCGWRRRDPGDCSRAGGGGSGGARPARPCRRRAGHLRPSRGSSDGVTEVTPGGTEVAGDGGDGGRR
jgi:L-threonylcarbamoyladenylate synthase